MARAALKRDEQGTYVWVVENDHVRRQPVTIGTELGDQIQIATGLTGSESVVVGEATGLTDGSAVRVATERH